MWGFFSPEVGICLTLQARRKYSSKFNSETITAVQVVTVVLVLFLPLQQSLVPVRQDFCLLAPSLASLSASSFPWKPA